MKNLAGGHFLSALSLGLLLILAACSDKQPDTIIGRWARGNEGTVTFTPDGQVIDHEGDRVDKGRYSLTNDALTLKLDAVSNASKFTVVFPRHNELLLTLQPEPGDAPMPGSRTAVSFTRVSH